MKDHLIRVKAEIISEARKEREATGVSQEKVWNKIRSEHASRSDYIADILPKDRSTVFNGGIPMKLHKCPYTWETSNGNDDESPRKKFKCETWSDLVDVGSKDLIAIPILVIKPVPEAVEVYDLAIDTNHNFLASSVVVHNCMISHGSAGWLKERLFLVSDEYRVHVCNICGLMAIANLKKNVYECKACGNKTQISQIYLPYAFKLMIQELMAMAIAPRLVASNTE
jgi:ribosomal protein L37AE/L43A